MSRAGMFFLLGISPILAILLALLGFHTLPNPLGALLMLTGIAYPAGVIVSLFIRKNQFWRGEQNGKVLLEDAGDRSFWAILPGILAVFFVPPAETLTLPALLPRGLGMQIAGATLFVLAVALRIWTRRAMRDQYTGHVQVTSEQILVTHGPYRFVRHPSYLSFLLLGLAVAIGYGSLIGLACIPVLLLPGLVYRIQVEERLLREHFKGRFTVYARRTKRLIPLIW